MRRSHRPRYAARLAVAAVVESLLVLGPSAALAEAPSNTTPASAGLCASMDNDWL